MKSYFLWAAARLLPIIGIVYPLIGQTRVDLRSQSKSIDFSDAQSTRPFPVKPTLPPLCQVGEVWFKSGSGAGQNLYLCSATNVWTGVASGDAVSTGAVKLTAGLSMNVGCVTNTSGTTCTLGVNPGNVAIPDGNNLFSGITSFPATQQQILTSGTRIVCNATRVSISAAAPVVLTATPVIADPVRDGQVCILQNTGTANITLTSGTAPNLKLMSPSVTLSPGDPLILIWDQTSSLWTQAGSRTRSAAQLLNSTPVCFSSLGQMTTMTLPPAAVGDSIYVTILLGKTSGDSMQFRVRQNDMSGADMAYSSLSGPDTLTAIKLRLIQYSVSKVAVVSESVYQNANNWSGVFDVSHNAGTPLLMAIGHASCSGVGQKAWIMAATAQIVEAQ